METFARRCRRWCVWGLLAAPVLSAAPVVRLGGSDFLDRDLPRLVQAGLASLAEPPAPATAAAPTEAPAPPAWEAPTVDYRLDGTATALEGLQAGRLDVALIAEAAALPEALVKAGWVRVPVAYQVAVVAVSVENPIDELSFAQLRQALAATAGNATWGALGLGEPWSGRPIVPALVEAPRHLGTALLRHEALGGAVWRSGLPTFSTPAAAFAQMANQPGALLVLPQPIEGAGFRWMALTATADGAAFGPSAENIHFGDYPLRIPFVLLLPPSASNAPALWAPLVQALLSDAAVVHWESAGFVALPSADRAALRARWPLPVPPPAPEPPAAPADATAPAAPATATPPL